MKKEHNQAHIVVPENYVDKNRRWQIQLTILNIEQIDKIDIEW